MPISFNGTTGAVTGIVSAFSTDISTSLVPRTGATGAVNLSGATLTGAGIDLINTTTFSAASSVLINNCFSSNYDNYKILLRNIGTASGSINAQFRSGGTTYSSSTYRWQVYYSDYTSTTVAASGSNAGTFFQVGYATTSTEITVSDMTVYGPFLIGRTGFTESLFGTTSAFAAGGSVLADNSFDGIAITPVGGTITGSIRIYGYRNA
jgi:hypothetical protein